VDVNLVLVNVGLVILFKAMSSWPDFRVLLDKSVNAVAVSFFLNLKTIFCGAPGWVRHRIATILWRTRWCATE